MTDFQVRFYAAAIIVFISAYGLSAQTDVTKKPDFSVGIFGNGPAIVYAKDDDGLPVEIDAKGTIVAASVSGTYCGIVATGGTLKIKLDEKVRDYDDNFLYVIVLCLAGKENENLVGKHIELKVKKMTEFPYSFGVRLANSIDSHGTPFYLSTLEGVGGLLKQIKAKK